MGDKTKIQWSEATWTPIRARHLETNKIGWHCEHDTTGCINCYSEAMNLRLGTGLPFKPGHRKDIKLFLDQEMLLAPMRWKRPRMIFVCSMTDLFADFVDVEWVDKIFAVMALCPQHTFQVLTKRAERMRDYFTRKPRDPAADLETRLYKEAFELSAAHDLHWPKTALPLSNVWLGVSCERQQEADERIPFLLQTPAAIRFVSAEPLLGPIDLTAIEAPEKVDGERWTFDALTNGDYYTQHGEPGEPTSCGDGPYREHALSWVIIGGESGSKARDHDIDWDRSIIAQCKEAGVPVFEKQLGARPVSSKDRCAFSLNDKKGGDINEWPEDLRVREFPTNSAPAAQTELL